MYTQAIEQEYAPVNMKIHSMKLKFCIVYFFRPLDISSAASINLGGIAGMLRNLEAAFMPFPKLGGGGCSILVAQSLRQCAMTSSAFIPEGTNPSVVISENLIGAYGMVYSSSYKF